MCFFFAGLLCVFCSEYSSGQSYYIIENFTNVLPSGDEASCGLSGADAAKIGLNAATVTYSISERTKRASLYLPMDKIAIPRPGRLTLWVKGDGSGNEMTLTLRTALEQWDPRNKTWRTDRPADMTLEPKIKLDFADWREVSFAMDKDRLPEATGDGQRVKLWWHALEFHPHTPPRGNGPAPEPRLSGTVVLDDMRLYSGEQKAAASRVQIIGPVVRTYATGVACSADLRNFTNRALEVRARVSMIDRNKNLVADREFVIELPAGGRKELALPLEVEQIGAYLPPFDLTCELLSAEVSELVASVSHKLVMNNSWFLLDDMSDVYTRWFRLTSAPRISSLGWQGYVGENQRVLKGPQTVARISRVPVQANGNAPVPPGRYAMQVDFTANTIIFTGHERYLPGNAFRLGIWVKPDGGDGALRALTYDYTDHGDFYAGGWRRTGGYREVCKLDFSEWRYCEIPLVGNGLGSNTPAGSTNGVDFPLELCALVVGSDKADGTAEPRSVQIGPIYVYTQQALAGTLALHMGYDDPDHRYAPRHNAQVTVQNAAVFEDRTIQANWKLTDKAGETIAEGGTELEIPARERREFRIDLSQYESKIAPRPGPLRLRATAYNKADASVTVSREIILAKPDAIAVVQDFESDTDYFAYRSAKPVAFATTDQAHGGSRSLALDWSAGTKLVAIDPTVPGVPCELSMWVWGDQSNVVFYPLITDRYGVVHGAGGLRWNTFLTRAPGAAGLQNVVRVNWNGWKKLTFRLPVIQPNWNVPLPCLRFYPNYPLGVHLGVSGAGAKAPDGREAGRIYVDDITVRTHIDPDDRLVLRRAQRLASNVLSPGTVLDVTVANFDTEKTRKGKLDGGVIDWRGRRVAGVDQSVELEPGETTAITIGKGIDSGAYLFRVSLTEGGKILGAIEDDLIVADLEPILGEDVSGALHDVRALRRAVGDRYELINEDWDWVEHHPASLQTDTALSRVNKSLRAGNEPHALLGYSAYWASGMGLEQVEANRFVRPLRNEGTGVDVFLVPERLNDWDIYVREMMRDVGDLPKCWVLWDRPDGSDSLAVKPEYFAGMLRIVGKWRRRYSPHTPVLIGGMSRDTAIPYIRELRQHGALGTDDRESDVNGVNVRLSVGAISPEDAQLTAYARELRTALDGAGRTQADPTQILFTALDWGTEKGSGGISVFDQAAYLCRSILLLRKPGVENTLIIHNPGMRRLGTGLVYRGWIDASPSKVRPAVFRLKPSWLCVRRTIDWLEKLKPAGEVEIQDVVPGRTRCLLFIREADGKPIAFVWRNNEAGYASFAPTGYGVESAEDMFGTAITGTDGWYPIGKLPVAFVLTGGPGDESASQAMSRLGVRDEDQPTWPQQTIAAFTPSAGARQQYQADGAKPATFDGRSAAGEWQQYQAVSFAQGGAERFRVELPKGAGLVLRKRFFLGDTGQSATVSADGRALGTWDLTRSAEELSKGFREAIFIVDAKDLAGAQQAEIELKYQTPANTIGWRVFEYRGGDFPVSAVGAVHADQNLAFPRYARNIIGERLAIGEEKFANGIGVWARSLFEIALNGQFSKFSATVGLDAATDGRGSVVFRVAGDGRELWNSSKMSGLDDPKETSVDIGGVKRLRLIVDDGGDGNAMDAADWCEPTLYR